MHHRVVGALYVINILREPNTVLVLKVMRCTISSVEILYKYLRCAYHRVIDAQRAINKGVNHRHYVRISGVRITVQTMCCTQVMRLITIVSMFFR